MFRLSLTIHTADDVLEAIAELRSAITDSNVSPERQATIIASANEIMSLWRQQLLLDTTQKLRADRTFEGDGYDVRLKVRPRSLGLRGLLSRLGLG